MSGTSFAPVVLSDLTKAIVDSFSSIQTAIDVATIDDVINVGGGGRIWRI